MFEAEPRCGGCGIPRYAGAAKPSPVLSLSEPFAEDLDKVIATLNEVVDVVGIRYAEGEEPLDVEELNRLAMAVDLGKDQDRIDWWTLNLSGRNGKVRSRTDTATTTEEKSMPEKMIRWDSSRTHQTWW